MYANGTCQRFLGHVCIHNSDSADRVYLRVETKAINGRFNEDGIDRDNVNERFGETRSQSDRICRAAWLPPPPSKHSANCGGQKLISCADAVSFETRMAAGNYLVTNNNADTRHVRHYRGWIRGRSTCTASILGRRRRVILAAAITTHPYVFNEWVKFQAERYPIMMEARRGKNIRGDSLIIFYFAVWNRYFSIRFAW